jgi:hypothetical protein
MRSQLLLFRISTLEYVFSSKQVVIDGCKIYHREAEHQDSEYAFWREQNTRGHSTSQRPFSGALRRVEGEQPPNINSVAHPSLEAGGRGQEDKAMVFCGKGEGGAEPCVFLFWVLWLDCWCQKMDAGSSVDGGRRVILRI